MSISKRNYTHFAWVYNYFLLLTFKNDFDLIIIKQWKYRGDKVDKVLHVLLVGSSIFIVYSVTYYSVQYISWGFLISLAKRQKGNGILFVSLKPRKNWTWYIHHIVYGPERRDICVSLFIFHLCPHLFYFGFEILIIMAWLICFEPKAYNTLKCNSFYFSVWAVAESLLLYLYIFILILNNFLVIINIKNMFIFKYI